jgi:hypothetical protein
MRRLPTMLASASAAAFATLAITVAVPAIAGNAGGAKQGDELSACLRDHGLAGAPAGADLKPWLGARLERGDGVTERALAACGSKPTVVKSAGPTEQDLRTCLAGHGVALPSGDGRALKTWLLEHGGDAANRDAMKACHFLPPEKAVAAGPCVTRARGLKAPAGGGRPGTSASAD